MPADPPHDYSTFGLEFATALVSRDYATAHAMTSSEYRRSTTVAEMQAALDANPAVRAGRVQVVVLDLSPPT
jgi:hypothetical protein